MEMEWMEEKSSICQEFPFGFFLLFSFGRLPGQTYLFICKINVMLRMRFYVKLILFPKGISISCCRHISTWWAVAGCSECKRQQQQQQMNGISKAIKCKMNLFFLFISFCFLPPPFAHISWQICDLSWANGTCELAWDEQQSNFPF